MTASAPSTPADPIAPAALLAQLRAPLQALQGKTFVVKYGGNAMTDSHLQACFAQDMVLLKQFGVRVVVVHGGGPQIDAALQRLHIEGRFVHGMRVTDEATMQAAQWVLCGEVQQQIVAAIHHAGGLAIGLCGHDGQLFSALPLAHPSGEHLGRVGALQQVRVSLLETLLDAGYTPVISPVASDATAAVTDISAKASAAISFNINADVVAGRIAAVLQAQRLLMLTNIAGVKDARGETLAELSPAQIEGLIADGSLSGGMLPKIAGALDAAKQGVAAVQILDGREPHSVLQALLWGSAQGTVIRAACETA